MTKKKLFGVLVVVCGLVLMCPLFYPKYSLVIKIASDMPEKEIALKYNDETGNLKTKKRITEKNGKAEFEVNQEKLQNLQVIPFEKMKIEELIIKGKDKTKLDIAKGTKFENLNLKAKAHLDFQVLIICLGILGGVYLLIVTDWRKEMATEKMPTLKNIEFLRIVYTLGIVVFHVLGVFAIDTLGSVGVELFFILSGYFLVLTFKPEKQALGFIQQKFIRLAPLMVFGTILCGGYLSWVTSLFFLQNTGLINGDIVNVPSWYLGVLFWVLLFYFYMMKCLNVKLCNFLIGIISFIAYVICVKADWLRVPLELGYFPCGMFRGIASVGLGCLLARICCRDDAAQLKGVIYSCFEALVLFWCVWVVFVPYKFWREIMPMDNRILIVIGQALVLLMFVEKKGFISQLFENPVFVVIARYCLAVYLTHWAIYLQLGNLFNNEIHHDWLITHKLPVVFFSLISACLLGVFAHHAVEKPAAKWLKKVLS